MSGGGRPESRERDDKLRQEFEERERRNGYVHGELNETDSNGMYNYPGMEEKWLAAKHFYEAGERDMAERAAHLENVIGEALREVEKANSRKVLVILGNEWLDILKRRRALAGVPAKPGA